MDHVTFQRALPDNRRTVYLPRTPKVIAPVTVSKIYEVRADQMVLIVNGKIVHCPKSTWRYVKPEVS
jgi:hypothetical protein